MVSFIIRMLFNKGYEMDKKLEEKQVLELVFRGSGTKIINSALNVTHEMPEVTVEANSVEEGYEIARFKYHDIGYNIVHSLQCINGKRNSKTQ